MSLKERVQKILLELEETKDFKDIKENIVKDISSKFEKKQREQYNDSVERMNKFFDNVTKNIKTCVKEVIQENPELLEGKNEKVN